jgi:chromosome segregation ATPase
VAEVKQRVMEYENRLRYANDVIQNLESENQQVEIDVAQARGAIESQNRAYNELKNNFYLMNSNSDSNGLGGSKSYLSNIKKTTINLMENLAPPSSKGIHNSNARESKVTFSPN